MDNKPISVTIVIGNSDNKLTQYEWYEFVQSVKDAIEYYLCEIHFFGAPPSYAKWQNTAWVIECPSEEHLKGLRKTLVEVRGKYKQEYLSWIVGSVELI